MIHTDCKTAHNIHVQGPECLKIRKIKQLRSLGSYQVLLIRIAPVWNILYLKKSKLSVISMIVHLQQKIPAVGMFWKIHGQELFSGVSTKITFIKNVSTYRA